MVDMSLSLGIKEGVQPNRSTEVKLQEELTLQNYTIFTSDSSSETRLYVNNGRSQECRCGWPSAGSAGLPSSLFP